MTTAIRKEALQVLEDLGNCYPNMRLGQLVSFVCTLAGEDSPKELYDIEDEELLAAAKEHLQKTSNRVPY
jgi:hypothetical protein